MFWGISDDIEGFFILFHEIQAILHRQGEPWVGVAKDQVTQELIEDFNVSFCQFSTGPWALVP